MSRAVLGARKYLGLVAALFFGMAILIWLVFELPNFILTYRGISLPLSEQLEAESAIRSSILQLLGGTVLFMGLLYTAKSFNLTREGHITDRYSKAIEHLGNSSADIRIGGIYALSRITRDSESDCQMVIEVLTAFIRQHTQEGHRTPSKEKISSDVQTAISVLAERPSPSKEKARLDFYHCGLNDANFRQGNFERAMFYYCRLDGASFAGANIEDAGFSFCTAERAAFSSSKARGANFVNARYTNCWFITADFTDCDFYGTDLSGSDFGRRYEGASCIPIPPSVMKNVRLENAKLKGTNFCGVDLSSVRGLTAAQISEAAIDENTVLPTYLSKAT